MRGFVLLIVLLAIPAAGGTVAARKHPKTANEYFSTLRSMGGMGIYAKYGELETIHSRALTEIQVGKFDSTERKKMDAVIGLFRSFSNASDHAKAADYRAAFASAKRVDHQVSTLREYDRTSAVLAQLALTRFYKNLGDKLGTQASEANKTSVEIELRSMAATAYRRANEPKQAAEYIRQTERLRARYHSDLEFMNTTTSRTAPFLQQCQQCTSPIGAIGVQGLDVFTRYQTARAHYWNVTNARQRATANGLKQRSRQLDDLASRVGAVWRSLAVAAVGLVVGYGLLIALIAMFVVWRVFSWKADYLAARVDSVVAMGDNDV